MGIIGDHVMWTLPLVREEFKRIQARQVIRKLRRDLCEWNTDLAVSSRYCQPSPNASAISSYDRRRAA